MANSFAPEADHIPFFDDPVLLFAYTGVVYTREDFPGLFSTFVIGFDEEISVMGRSDFIGYEIFPRLGFFKMGLGDGVGMGSGQKLNSSSSMKSSSWVTQ